MKKLLLIIFVLFSFSSCFNSKKTNENKISKKSKTKGENLDKEENEGLFAKINTDKGDILIKLFYKKTPMTVSNFVGLADGKIKGKAFYDGLTFHRVEKGFVIQGGDPKGDGSGGPGYEFPNEIDSSLSHEKGIVSMANAGPDTNGSQFFITLSDFKQLDGQYSIFGKVEKGMDVVEKIAVGDIIKKVDIITKDDDAKKFVNSISKDSFNSLVASKKEEVLKKNQKQNESDIKKSQDILSKLGEVQTSPDGIMYVITQPGNGDKPSKGQEVECNYTLKLLDGKKVDSSLDRGETFKFPIGVGKVIKGWDLTLMDMQKGEKRTIIIPPNLGYGSRGAGGVIPANAFLRFDIELVDFK